VGLLIRIAWFSGSVHFAMNSGSPRNLIRSTQVHTHAHTHACSPIDLPHCSQLRGRFVWGLAFGTRMGSFYCALVSMADWRSRGCCDPLSIIGVLKSARVYKAPIAAQPLGLGLLPSHLPDCHFDKLIPSATDVLRAYQQSAVWFCGRIFFVVYLFCHNQDTLSAS